MNSRTQRRDDRSAADPYKQRAPADSKYSHDYDSERRRNRSATVPSHSYDPRSYPPQDTRHNDPRQPSRSYRQDPHHPPAAPYPSSYHHASAQAPQTSRAYQHSTRTPAQHSSSGYHYPQPSSFQPSHSTPAYPVAASSRRPHPETSDPRSSKRTAPAQVQQANEHMSSGEEMPRPSRHASRPLHSSTQPPISAPSNQTFWNPTQDMNTPRRHKDSYVGRERDQEREREKERERERDKPTAELENRYKDRARAERYRERERERERERAPETRYQEPSRSRPYDKRKDSDTERPSHPDPRNASKVSLTGREGHSAAAREPSSGHRRHRTEDGTTSTGRRHQPENMQNPITMPSQSASVPQPDVQQTGEPPPAPRVMPVYLPSKAKSQRSHRDGRPSTAQGAQSGSDTERVTASKHRIERTSSGPAIQRSDAHASSSTKDRSNHDVQVGPRDDARRLEGKYGAHQDIRQPLAPINVDIPLVTPGFNASALPTETRPPIAQQIVSIRAGQGPSDPHDTHLKSLAISHSGTPQDIDIHPPHPSSASIVKARSRTRLQSSDTRAQPDRPAVVERSRTEPRADDLPPGQRVSIHEPSRAMPIPISKPSYPRGNPEVGADNLSSSYPHSRPPSRSAHRTSVNNTIPPAVVGPRPLRSASQGPQTNEPPTRPPSMAQHGPISSIPNQQSVPQPFAHPTNGSPSRTGHTHGLLSFAQPSPKNAQLHGVTLSHSTSTQHTPSAPPSTHQTPVIVPQTFASSSRPSTRDGAHANAPTAQQQPADRQSTADMRSGSRQPSNSATLEASWVVQTPATVRKAKISREDKYSRDPRFTETPHPQLRQVLSQDDDPFPRTSSSMMKASQATTPATSSQRNSPGTKSRDAFFGTPRGTSANNSPRYGSAKETPTPDHIPRQNLPPHVAGPPQIAIVGATPLTMVRELPHGRVDHGLLAPPFPAPTRTSRTTSSSQDQLSEPPQLAVGITPPTSHQPSLAQVVHAPSLFQPYRPPSLPIAEDNGQFSPPPIPIPPPKGPEDSPPPPIETRTSEIIPTRSQSDEPFQNYAHSVPEVQSEMFHLPSQPPAPSLFPSVPSPHTTHGVQPSKPDNNTGPTPMLDGSANVAPVDARLSKPPFFQPDDVPIVHQEIMLSVPSQSSAPHARLRPKVTIEDVPEDSPVLSKPVTATAPTATPLALESRPIQPPHHTTLAKANSSSQSAVVNQPSHRHSPQANNKDAPLYRGAESSTMPTAPPMPPPPPTVPSMSARVPSYAPPPQATSFPTAPAAPAQRAAAQTGPSRTYQRAAEMLQASKLSTSAGTNPGAMWYVNKSAAAPVQTAFNSAISVIGQHQPMNGASVQGPSSSRPVNATTAAALPTASITASIPKATTHPTTIGPDAPGGALGLHVSTPSSNGVNIPPPSVADMRQQPGRPGPLLTPSVDIPSTSVPSTVTIRNPHQEQPILDSTRPRDIPSTTRPIPPSSHTYPATTRPSTSSATTQHTHVTPAQPPTHHRVASLPTTSSSLTTQKPPSPRKYSQPIPSTSASTQPFPSRPPAPESQSARAPASAQGLTPAPVRLARLPFPDRTNDPDMLNTPSSIAPSPMLNPDAFNVVPQPMAVPIRTRKSSTDSKDDKKKPGIFGTIFRARTLSSKAAEPPAVSTAARASVDQVRAHPDVSVVASTPVSCGVMPTSAPKESSSSAPPTNSAPFYVRSQAKPKAKVPHPVAFPPPTQALREQRDNTSHIFTPFKFLHSKRNRTVSAASLDVCDGNTATNTVIGSPDLSTISQAPPLPPIITPGVRDPLVAASQWRDREEAERRERIRRPGVTFFGLEEEPPSPAPGTTNKRKRLVRRGSGRAPSTPGPPRS